jgi:heptosyltransferase-3
MKGQSTKISSVIISRTDSIGDVMLTLPMAGIIKKNFPGCKVLFLGRSYTKAVIACCEHIDEFINWDELKTLKAKESAEKLAAYHADALLHVFPDKAIASIAKQAGIPIRVGTSHRLYHLVTCNRLVRFSRKNSDLHESQLNLKLLPGIGIEQELSCKEINAFTGFNRLPTLPERLSQMLTQDKFNLLLHPRSKGSAREWGIDNFSRLIQLLPENKFRIFISGTKEEGSAMKEFISAHPSAIDLTGKLSLEEFIAFLAGAHGIVAGSTGPLHIASALGKRAIGIYAPMHPIHPGRWAPIGIHAEFLVKNQPCSDCRKSNDCHCIREITPQQVSERLLNK